MSTLRYGLLALIVASLLSGFCLAQQASPEASIWAEWEGEPAERHGPDVAAGVLLVFHGTVRPSNVGQIPMSPLFVEMAKVAKWDILRINRLMHSDFEADDRRILQFTAEQVAQARRDGYKRVFVGGASRGGWLALSSAQLADVDGVVALTPGTTHLYAPSILDRRIKDLARRVSDAKARRIAVFLLEGDPRAYVQEGHGAILRKALEQTTSRFMIVDRPPDLLGYLAVVEGRLVRRYRDCLLQFLLSETVGPGEDECSTSNGYAAGTEIDFPNAEPLMSVPFGADRGFAQFLGRWEGDDEAGAYVIAQSIAADVESITFLYGFSPAAASRTGPWLRELRFRFDQGRAQIITEMFAAGFTFALMLPSAGKLEHEIVYSSPNYVRKFLLRNPNSSRKR